MGLMAPRLALKLLFDGGTRFLPLIIDSSSKFLTVIELYQLGLDGVSPHPLNVASLEVAAVFRNALIPKRHDLWFRNRHDESSPTFLKLRFPLDDFRSKIPG